MSKPKRLGRIFLLNEGIIFIPFLILFGLLYFEEPLRPNQSFFNTWAFVIALVIFIYMQVCAVTLTILHYFNVTRKWILCLSLLFALLLAINQLGFYYFNLQDLLQRILDTGIYLTVIMAFQISFQLLSEYLCRRLKLIA